MRRVARGMSVDDRPTTPTEEIVASIWATELGLPNIGLDDDFIDLGSHSLQGVAIAARLEERFGFSIPVRVLFEEPTVTNLAAWIERQSSTPGGTRAEIIRFGAWIERQRARVDGTQAEIICLQEGSGLRPIFAVPEGRAAARALYGLAKLARETDRRRPVYAFPGDPPVPAFTPEDGWVRAAATCLIDAMCTRQRVGPYLLFGGCVGGIIAWEMARQLEAGGEAVHLFLVDTMHPRARSDAESRSRTEKRARHSGRKVTNARLERTRLYRPEPLVGRVRLFANSDWHRVHPTLGWDALAIDSQDIAVMPEEHGLWSNFSEVAGWLRAGIDEVDLPPLSTAPAEHQPSSAGGADECSMTAGLVPAGAVRAPATIIEALAGWAERTRGAPALFGPDGDLLDYGRFAAEVERLAAALRELGIGRNDPIIVILPDGPALATMILASMTAGIAFPLSWGMTRHEYTEAISTEAGCVVVLPAGQESPARDAATEKGLPLIELALAPLDGAETFHLIGDPIGPPASGDHPRADDTALIINSSGTTGRPKRIPRTHLNITTTSDDVCRAMAVSPSDRCLNLAPMAFSQGLNALLTTVWTGGSLVALPGIDLANLPHWISTHRPTWFSATPSVLRTIATDGAAARAIREFPPRFIRASAGAISAAEIASLEERLTTTVLHSYGLSEASFIAGEHFAVPLRKPGSAGLPNHEVAIVLADGTPVPCGDTGEITVRGPHVFPGYVGDPDANAAAFLPQDWFRTGDVGRIDEDGFIFVTGRLKEMIKRAGLSISPHEIEAVLLTNPAVAEACVFGIPHPDLGEDVAAAVVIRPGADVTERLLRDRVASRLSPQKVPRTITFVNEIPRTPTGKPIRSALAAAAVARFRQPETGGYSSRVEQREETAVGWSDVAVGDHRDSVRR